MTATDDGADEQASGVIRVVEVPERVERLAARILTWVEMQEAEASRFGIYEATTRGQEVVDQFLGRPFEEENCQSGEILLAVRELREQSQLVLLSVDDEAPEQPDGWVFRSRMGELVRLLARLKQRFAWTELLDATTWT